VDFHDVFETDSISISLSDNDCDDLLTKATNKRHG
jgi:hypothetical protein